MPVTFHLGLNEISTGKSRCRFAGYFRMRNGWRRIPWVSGLKTLKTAWNDDSNRRVLELAVSGASAARASAALNRSISAVRMQASKLGTPFLANQTIKEGSVGKMRCGRKNIDTLGILRLAWNKPLRKKFRPYLHSEQKCAATDRLLVGQAKRLWPESWLSQLRRRRFSSPIRTGL
jgi:hypothetical protein